MSRLKVMLRGALISEIELKKENEYIGGRKEGCDIRLQAEKGISREHFKIKFTDGQWELQAVSRFGDVFSLGQKVELVQLAHGQSFQIPPYEFILLDVPEAESTSPQLNTNEVNEHEQTVIGAAPQIPFVKLMNSSGEVREMLRLEIGDIWVAGRDPSCQIIIADQRVSRRQFEIHKSTNGYFNLLDLASVNGTFLNGSPVSSTDPSSLKSGDVITVLDNTMYFELHDPNFKYKVAKIEIPPMEYIEDQPVSPSLFSSEPSSDNQQNEFEPPAQNGYAPSAQNANAPSAQIIQQGFVGATNDPANIGYLSEIPQIQQDNYNPQLDPTGGPFTGMPYQSGPQQYYTFDSSEQNPSEEAPPKGLQKLFQNKPLLIIFVLLFLGGSYYLSELLNEPEASVPQANQAADPNNPLALLPAEKQTQVKELYQLAELLVEQEKYDLALDKLTKLHEIMKEGYKDSKELEARANNNLKTIEQNLQDQEMENARNENLKKIAEISKKCESLISPQLKIEEMRECLAPMSQIDATAPEYTKLMSEAEKIEKENELKEAQRKNLELEVEELKALFKKAEQSQTEGLAYKAIKNYTVVVKSKLHDPGKLKQKAEQRIVFIEKKIAEKTSKSMIMAESYLKDGRLKNAVSSLRESLAYDPDNKSLREKIDSYKEELRRQARTLYQESIIDESYGIIESNEVKLGAKDKWKKIVELDLDDGEYYKKAVIKLKRYGLM